MKQTSTDGAGRALPYTAPGDHLPLASVQASSSLCSLAHNCPGEAPPLHTGSCWTRSTVSLLVLALSHLDTWAQTGEDTVSAEEHGQ